MLPTNVGNVCNRERAGRRARAAVTRRAGLDPLWFRTMAAMALAVVVIRPERSTLRALIDTAAAWSIALLLALVIAWSAIAAYVRPDRWPGALVTNAAEVDAFLAAHLPSGADVIRLPTGVLVQSIEFLSGGDVRVTGFVWQRYVPEAPDDLKRGVVLVEGVEAADVTTEAFRDEADGVETVGWSFAATLRQPFEYAGYPFDEQAVWIRLWPRDFTQDVVLVPISPPP